MRPPIARLFHTRGWSPLPFQLEAWQAYDHGESGLIHVPTGSGKTLAATLAALCQLAEHGGKLVYISPLKAMTRSIAEALTSAITDMSFDLVVETRTGDTSASTRSRQRKRLPQVLVTTPESLSLLLADPHAAARLGDVRALVIDEWHELIPSKRGTQTELAAARLRAFSPGLQTWALSATLANTAEAAAVAVGAGGKPTMIHAAVPRPIVITTLLPEHLDDLPWAGHIGLILAPKLIAWLDPARPTLIFTNTRAQCELWHEAIRAAHPDWPLGIHHGSVDSAMRERVEQGLNDGNVRIVVATSSLDLGVDLSPVERVVQIGSPKGIARLMQRAGRSGHRPGSTSHVLCVPTHALQLVEIAAVREALVAGVIEARRPLRAPLDVLAQHVVTCALGGGFVETAMLAEVRTAWSYRNLSDEAWQATLELVMHGGLSLRAYPQFRKVVRDGDLLRVTDPEIAQVHRGSIGTITGDETVTVRLGTVTLGQIDESFIAGIPLGGHFHFAGRHLELFKLKDAVASVRPGHARRGVTPHWPGNTLPISGSLGAAVRGLLARGNASAEWEVVAPLIAEQARVSRLPQADELLVECFDTTEGAHLMLYPFAGRAVHEGLAALLALRMLRKMPLSVGIAVDDYGMELLSPEPVDWAALIDPGLFADENLMDDILLSVNATELARRRFRDVARVAGFVNPGPVYKRNTARQVQTSASLLFDVLNRYDGQNLLLSQARREVLELHFDEPQLRETLARIRASTLIVQHPWGPTPLAMPIVADRLAGDKATSQTEAERVQKALSREARWAERRRRGLPGERRE